MTNEIIKMIRAERKQALADCWQYHGKQLKEDRKMIGLGLMRAELRDALDSMELDNNEDIAWFIGYISALDTIESVFEKKNTNK